MFRTDNTSSVSSHFPYLLRLCLADKSVYIESQDCSGDILKIFQIGQSLKDWYKYGKNNIEALGIKAESFYFVNLLV